MPFAATYHPKLKDLLKLIKNLQLFLYRDSEVRRVFSTAPIVFYQSELVEEKDYIVRSKLYPIKLKVEGYRCANSRCQVCTSIQVTYSFSKFLTKSDLSNHS